MSTPLNIIFAGTPEFAADHLAALLTTEHNIIAVYTQPDRPAGRGKKLTPSAVKTLAEAHAIPVLQPENFRSPESQAELSTLNADLMIVVAYGLLLPQIVLDAPRLGCINVHGSLLPRWRGAAPIQRAIWAGDDATGVTIMQMDIGLDTGAMLYKTHLPITQEDTSASLYQKLAQQGPQALVHVVNDFDAFTPVQQDNAHANYAKKLSKDEAHINWHLSAEQLARNVRAFNPWPVAFFTVEDEQGKPQNIKVWVAHTDLHQDTSNLSPGQIISATKQGLAIATSDGVLVITQCQIPGKKAMPISDIINARASWFTPGHILSSSTATAELS
ncbi:MAG: methionyl-tRNA formyltransferase [Glaciecola sp.]|nr:methionyl-tRNA formyltransferase [Glaciecola sp.]MDG1815691.1 methionyl-tRNA formyltransferase [Glaciecola sp.]MDG2098210.1 methionyl-tRNA formyltransferase [Glaciecola sp.]